MLKRVVTAAVGVVGLVLVGLGVASATLWRADDVLVATASTGAHTYVTDPGVLELGGDPATVRITAPGDAHVVLAVGRDTDVAGWVGTDAHARVRGLSGWRTLNVTPVAAAPAPTDAPPTDAPTPAQSPAPTDAPPATADPTGSDLWVVEATGSGSATLRWPATPGRWSLVAVSTGDAAPTLSISWPRVVTTPWLWPLVVVGALLFLGAAGALLWQEQRRRRGDEASWVPVTTGTLATVDAAAAGPLTRRQLREAAQAGGARPATGSLPTITLPTPDESAPAPAPSQSPAASPAAPGDADRTPAERPDRPASSAPITAPTSRRALRAAGALTGAIPTVPAPAPESLATGPSAASVRPAWVPAAPTGPARPDEAAPSDGVVPGSGGTSPDDVERRAYPRWLGVGASADSPAEPVSPAQDEAPPAAQDEGPAAATEPETTNPATSDPAASDPATTDLATTDPEASGDVDAADRGGEAGSGSRADAWRRAWGLPPLDADDAPHGEGRHGR